MKILRKVLHLNYTEPKGDKHIVKSYNFERSWRRIKKINR